MALGASWGHWLVLEGASKITRQCLAWPADAEGGEDDALLFWELLALSFVGLVAEFPFKSGPLCACSKRQLRPSWANSRVRNCKSLWHIAAGVFIIDFKNQVPYSKITSRL